MSGGRIPNRDWLVVPFLYALHFKSNFSCVFQHRRLLLLMFPAQYTYFRLLRLNLELTVCKINAQFTFIFPSSRLFVTFPQPSHNLNRCILGILCCKLTACHGRILIPSWWRFAQWPVMLGVVSKTKDAWWSPLSSCLCEVHSARAYVVKGWRPRRTSHDICRATCWALGLAISLHPCLHIVCTRWTLNGTEPVAAEDLLLAHT